MFDSLTEPICPPADRRATLSSIKKGDERTLELAMLADGVHRWVWLRSMLKVFSAFQHSDFMVPEDYDYSKST